MDLHDVEWHGQASRREQSPGRYLERSPGALAVREGTTWAPAGAGAGEAAEPPNLSLAQKAMALEDAVLLVGHRWKPTVLFCLSSGPKRRRALEQHMPHGVSANVLTKQLRALEEDGLVLRIDNTDEGHGRHVTYALSAFGETLLPTIAAFSAWSFANAARLRAGHRSARASGREPSHLDER